MRSGPSLALALCFLAVAGVTVPAVAGTVPVDRSPVTEVDAAGSASAGTHGNHVSIDPQVTSDGTVIVETVSTLTPSFVVLRTDDDGRPGDPVGHTFIDTASFRTSVGVDVDSDTWSEWSGNRTLWAVLHADDGDGEFDPETDQSLASRAPTASASFVLGSDDSGAVRVLARSFGPQTVQNGALTVRRVDLASTGFLAAKPVDDDRVVGSASLGEGSHENVSLSLNETFADAQRDRFRVRLVAYRDDGDGQFDDGDRPVLVGNQSVGTSIVVEKGTEGDSNATATTGEPLVVTPSPTPTTTATATATTTSSAGSTSQPPSATSDRPTTGTSTAAANTGASGPGFGILVAGCALLLLGLRLGRHRH